MKSIKENSWVIAIGTIFVVTVNPAIRGYLFNGISDSLVNGVAITLALIIIALTAIIGLKKKDAKLVARVIIIVFFALLYLIVQVIFK